MTYKVLVTETSTCLLTFDTEEEARAVTKRINRIDKLDDSEYDDHLDWMFGMIPGWDVETVAEVIE